ncbi:four-carbon acid sugar kinase family protein [Pantoea sp. Bo_2]|uniref:D-threonate kinase n=1 Tax=unclassified Pantoea TaxID=2630326 RepID=UPI001231A08C|nr:MULTISPECIES: four-carbon acid sugar kinase family protein [unclassified Pantoea]KAA5949239.1 four-carbon acid sugar kinase family protein [Pantoea sp. VH_3]KAA5954562.1 four-carbon acid sugar kinase family protein [Pantoea sp. VH_25]KAA5958732.1 four-carbon acid sugar kinase family protein [Pantoea sp. VH_24]KAA5961905.1 four-carbon acid sugar kinase family protein [Pantoea sp. VH_16]KAA5966351.1 four-carbon acid sugar kinase family protein [Pantoea sp. VH_18]
MGVSVWKTPVLVIADDFTGANDAGSGLAQAGARVHVLFGTGASLQDEAADVLVISTDSRAASATQAAEHVTQVVQHYAAQLQQGWLFKKIDSTLRGNVGAETVAALRASGKRLALVAPALPRLRRTTREGSVWVNQRLLTDTEFASDPKTPILSARILDQMQIDGTEIDLATLRSDRLDAVLAAAHGVVVVDAETEADLARLISAASRLSETPLLVGAAGLSDALGAALSVRPSRPVLAVVGSMSRQAEQQIAALVNQHAVEIVDVDIRQLFQQPAWSERERWREQAAAALRAGRHTVIRTCQHESQRHAIEDLCQQHRVTRQQLGEAICQLLGEMTLSLCRAQLPHALYLSGGDVAIAVAQALGASGFKIQGLVAGCVPHGVLLNSEFTLPVMTKAGGFGDENTLVAAIGFIEEKSSE